MTLSQNRNTDEQHKTNQSSTKEISIGLYEYGHEQAKQRKNTRNNIEILLKINM